ncbi:hypothetical protein GPL17_33120 [Bradyrhizobium yuanmingense]|uniref:hypothetical protein n=1 Tax=Bradyrhizobium yuanmingense TaxID=108015 RepID=UPI0012F91D79|nr:hypothetical protein [Bradyrhizobium yuanmingense]MVT55276.1 hypothetical protein [Bradyrhizobium yuanmingense]
MRLKLHSLGLHHLPIAFFNSATDEPESLRAFIAARTEAIRESHRSALREIIAGAKDLLANYEKEQAQAILRYAGRRLDDLAEGQRGHAAVGVPAGTR